MIRSLALAFALLPMGVSAQQASNGTGGELRVLDKVTGAVSDLNLAIGASEQIGYLRVTLNACRFPRSNPSGDAYAAITVWYRDAEAPVFSGWLVASAPALNAMDHPRYDVWSIRCTTP
jgi:hypothetical protein